MRRLLTVILAAGLVVCASMAGELRWTTVTNTCTGTGAVITNSIHGAVGPVCQIHVILGTATNVDLDVQVVSDNSSEGAAFVLYSVDDVVADAIVYPAFDRHGNDGAALTGDDPGLHYVVQGQRIDCILSDCLPTNGTAIFKVVHESMK